MNKNNIIIIIIIKSFILDESISNIPLSDYTLNYKLIDSFILL